MVAAAAAAVVMTAACTEDARAIDPFPIRVDVSRGPVALAVNTGEGPVPAIIDTGTPLTLMDRFVDGEPLTVARRRKVTVTLLGLDDVGEPTISRARFPDTTTIELHPCPGDGICRVGLDDEAVEFRGIVGADILARSAARFDFPSAELRFFPETSGDSSDLGDDCHAVIGQAFAGGGTLLVGGTEIVFGALRPVVGACLDQEGAPDDEERGSDALMMLSTGLGVSVLAASSYERYAAESGAPPLDSLPSGELHFPSGPAEVRLGQVGSLALVGSLGQTSEDLQDRGPCRELYLNRVMATRACEDPDSGIADDCPCPGQASFCTASAAVDIDRSIEVAVLDDGHPVLQALRDELRPEAPELDGILGTRALASLRLELDYLNDRMVMRCMVGDDCETLPAVRNEAARDHLDRCREQEAMLTDAGPPGDGGLLPPDAGADGGAP
ncbi:MAG TPA: hypothetical protein VNO33_12345 [Kofleriaceae bacterium]|nr:hypothetical protein [Kofleriaceae bacterium]